MTDAGRCESDGRSLWCTRKVEALQARASPLDGRGKHADGLGKPVICAEY
jgi:hypothetical protein